MEYEAFGDSGPPPDLAPCDYCGRKFNQNALSRHMPICAKSASKTRKVFDSSKQRADGTELAQFKKAPGSKKAKPAQQTRRHEQQQTRRHEQQQTRRHEQQVQPGSKNNWRQKHTEFINTIRAARGVQHALATGGPLPPPPPPTINPDYVQCPHCERRFNVTAAERHMPFCKEQHERLGKNKPNPTAKARQNARLQYKAPKLKKADATSPTSGYHGYSTSSSYGTRTVDSRAAADTHSMTNGQRVGYGTSSGHQTASRRSDGSRSGGKALRTGRTAETYSEARQLSAKQRSTMSPAGRQHSKPGTKTYDSPGYGGYSPSSATSGSPYGYSDDTSSKGHSNNASARFCHECGTRYPVPQAKFCCECGIRRATIA